MFDIAVRPVTGLEIININRQRSQFIQTVQVILLGWNPEACGNPITYDGGTLLDLNRHELIYQFDFS
ncbi:hypothetical protein O5833_26810, partial [Escherichia coli]|nr:hypothetical protein [Escherichia coli]